MIKLIRTNYLSEQTLGKMILYDDLGFPKYEVKTLENPWKNNKMRESCIPQGDYKIVKHTSPTFGETFWIQGVKDRSEILIHAGNFVDDTLGCILPGFDVVDIDGDGLKDVSDSRDALSGLLRNAEWNESEIRVTHLSKEMN